MSVASTLVALLGVRELMDGSFVVSLWLQCAATLHLVNRSRFRIFRPFVWGP